MIIGIFLLVIGVLLLLRTLGIVPANTDIATILWALFLLILGGYILMASQKWRRIREKDWFKEVMDRGHHYLHKKWDDETKPPKDQEEK